MSAKAKAAKAAEMEEDVAEVNPAELIASMEAEAASSVIAANASPIAVGKEMPQGQRVAATLVRRNNVGQHVPAMQFSGSTRKRFIQL